MMYIGNGYVCELEIQKILYIVIILLYIIIFYRNK